MKKCLILVISCQLPMWRKMPETSKQTWDSSEVEGCEVVYYYGAPVKENTAKEIYFDIEESYFSMSKKTIKAFDFALDNKDFDYIVRINSSTYVDKNKLMEYISTLPDKNVFAGVEVQATPKWCVGWSYVISKDVIEKIVAHKSLLRNDITDDLSLSYLINEIQVPYTKLPFASIDKREIGWACVCYNGVDSFEFTDFKDVKKANSPFYRVKQDYDRTQDKYLMEQLFKNL